MTERDPLSRYVEDAVSQMKEAMERAGHAAEPETASPPPGMGEISFPFFFLAKSAKRPPAAIAKEVFSHLSSGAPWTWELAGPYVNGRLDRMLFTSALLETVETAGVADDGITGGFGTFPRTGETRVVEHTSANPNGPLHVGRARNPIIGDTMARLYKAMGYDTLTQFYVDDMGLQVATLAWGVKNLSPDDVEPPERDREDYRLVRYYQEAHRRASSDKDVETAIRKMLRAYEEGSLESDAIQDPCRKVLNGMLDGLSRLGVSVDELVWESQFVRDGSVFEVMELLSKSPLNREEDDGARYLELAEEGIEGRSTRFFYRRSNGTSLYAARDIAYHRWKLRRFDGILDVLGEDHKLQSRQVAVGLRETGTPLRDTDVVMFYSFVSLPEGKMSTRKGRVVYLDDLIDEAVERAMDEVTKRRDDLDTSAREKIADAVGRGSVRFNIIKVQPEKKITFQWEDALNFDGDSAPFVQYANARCHGILDKAGETSGGEGMPESITDEEWDLVYRIGRFPSTVKEASQGSPHVLPRYLTGLVSSFNQFYRDCPVLKAEGGTRKFRLRLVKATSVTIENGLTLLGIPVLEEM